MTVLMARDGADSRVPALGGSIRKAEKPNGEVPERPIGPVSKNNKPLFHLPLENTKQPEKQVLFALSRLPRK
jgi:hypothetical protein